MLSLAGSGLANAVGRRLRGYFADLSQWDVTGATAWHAAAAAILAGAAPVVLAAVLGGAAVALLQTGFVLRPLAFDLSRLSPLAGIRRLFSPEHLMESAKALVKVAVLTIGLWHLMAAHLASTAASLAWSPTQLLTAIRRDVLQLLLYLIVVQAAITVLDLLWVRLRHAGRLKMSRVEVKEEQREAEGDPRIKARLRQIRHARMRRRMLAAVPKATLVVTNPTHYAVALAYQRGQAGAPVVVAKGADEVAARIREVAAAHRVPVLPNPMLARALYTVELDAEVPAEHFQAVAELIAYVWRMEAAMQPRGL